MSHKAFRIADEQRRAWLGQGLSTSPHRTHQEQAERNAARHRELTRQAEAKATITTKDKTT